MCAPGIPETLMQERDWKSIDAASLMVFQIE
jgi:hypothetical protein